MEWVKKEAKGIQRRLVAWRRHLHDGLGSSLKTKVKRNIPLARPRV